MVTNIHTYEQSDTFTVTPSYYQSCMNVEDMFIFNDALTFSFISFHFVPSNSETQYRDY